MSQTDDLRALALASIAHRCARETELFFQHQRYDPLFCLELFRRAIVDRCQRAWELVYVQYRPLVMGWITRHPAFATSGEEVHYFVNRAFEKMWAALGSDRFGQFPSLQSLLRYLQMCVHSAVLDHARKAERAAAIERLEDHAFRESTSASGNEDPMLDGVYRQEFWEQISSRLRSEQERLLLYGSFVVGLKPREIHARWPKTFRDVKEVYRVKQNVLERLRRDAALRGILDPNA